MRIIFVWFFHLSTRRFNHYFLRMFSHQAWSWSGGRAAAAVATSVHANVSMPLARKPLEEPRGTSSRSNAKYRFDSWPSAKTPIRSASLSTGHLATVEIRNGRKLEKEALLHWVCDTIDAIDVLQFLVFTWTPVQVIWREEEPFTSVDWVGQLVLKIPLWFWTCQLCNNVVSLWSHWLWPPGGVNCI